MPLHSRPTGSALHGNGVSLLHESATAYIPEVSPRFILACTAEYVRVLCAVSTGGGCRCQRPRGQHHHYSPGDPGQDAAGPGVAVLGGHPVRPGGRAAAVLLHQELLPLLVVGQDAGEAGLVRAEVRLQVRLVPRQGAAQGRLARGPPQGGGAPILSCPSSCLCRYPELNRS